MSPLRRPIPIVLALVCVLALPLSGHAILLSATPAMRAVIKGPDFPVTLKFNSRIDAKRSRLVLVTPDGNQSVLLLGTQVSPDTLSSQATRLKPGPYILRWQVLANDGHITRGEFLFQVQ
jgi:methionine-rich copper-binding protein CopC